MALIVGPVGSLTSSFRSLANAAAAEATAAGAEVVKVYSPNATWSAVQRAVTGASIVVYLGHGNGWPSRYRDALYPPTQNGFGLNPAAGVDDTAHQYFGEASIQNLHLASNAVVLLHHLCYASGNTEPGLPEGTQDQAIQRVDNFAAGFIRAGAKAVVAEAHLGPAYYVRALLRGRQSIEQIWNASPEDHGNTFSAASVRSTGFLERLDPDRPSGGYFRSLVSQGVTASEVRAGGTGSVGSSVVVQPPAPSLAGQGVRFGNLSLRALPIAATQTQLTLPVAGTGIKLVPAGAQVGIRWDPILLDPQPWAPPGPGSSAPGPDASPTPSPDATAPSDPAASADPAPSSDPVASADPTPTPPPEPPAVDLVAPEQLGTVVTVGPATRSGKGLAVGVTLPNAPGLYRLVATLHTPAGVAYDAATEGLLTPVLVRVSGPVAVAYGAPASLSVDAGSTASIPVRVVNAGSEVWDEASDTPPAGGLAQEILSWLRTSRLPAKLVATWVSTASLPVPDPVTVVLDPSVAVPGGAVSVRVDLVAPAEAGDYLLLLDVESPALGALSAQGSAPALVRVTVAASAMPPMPTTPAGDGSASSGGPASGQLGSPSPAPAVGDPVAPGGTAAG